MRYFEGNRRRVTKKQYIRGVLNSTVGEGEVSINESAGAPVYLLGISGNTIQEIAEGTPQAPDNPVDIKSSNDSGLTLVLHGKNLATAKEVYSVNSTVMLDGRECIKFRADKTTQFRIEGGFKEKTQYTISFMHRTERNLNPSQGAGPMTVFIKYKNLSTNYSRDTLSVITSGEFVFSKKTTLQGQTIDYIGCFGNTYSFDNYIDINSFMLEEGEVDTPVYEPYFKKEISFPTSVELTKNDGTTNTVQLPFTKYDKLIVDGKKKRVIYEKKSGVKTFDGSERLSISTYTGYQNRFCTTPDRLGFGALTGNGYCTHFVPNSTMYFKGDPAVLSNAKAISFLSNYESADEFKSWLASQKEAGTPLKIVSEYEVLEEIDITSTELAKSLLTLALPSGTSGRLYVKGGIGNEGLELEYYSEIEDQTCILGVSYHNQKGEEIADRKEYTVRKGSVYKVVPPHIEGYIILSEEETGVLKNSQEIILIYKEE